MIEIVSFLKENPIVSLATIDDAEPRVRPFQFQFEEKGRLYFCTANSKDVFRQLKANPMVELCSVSKDMRVMRLSGRVRFSNDLTVKEKIISGNELVRSVYKTAGNPSFEIFYLDHGKMKKANSPAEMPVVVEF